MTASGRLAMVLYGVAFALVLAALGSLLVGVHGLLQARWPLWLSVALSMGAIVLAVAGVVLDRRGTRSAPADRDPARS